MLRLMTACALAAAFCLAGAPLGAQQPASAAASAVFELAQVEVAPRPLNADEMAAALYSAYPPHLREAGINGSVVVSMIIGPDGQPREVQVVSATDTAFAAPTVAVAAQLRFSPAQVGGQAVAVRLVAPIGWEAGPPAEEAVEPDSGAYEVGDVEVPPRPRNVTELQRALERLYPPELRDLGVTGEVEVRFRVDEAGNVQSPSIFRSNDPRFNSATLAAIQVLRFIPARVGGKPVPTWVSVPIHWTIESIPLSEGWRYPVQGQAPW